MVAHILSQYTPYKGYIFRVFNCIYSRSKAASSEIVNVEFLKAYCLPCLLYAPESVSLSASQLHSLNNCINRAVHKIFGVRSAECINDVRRIVGLEDVAKLVENRRSKFIDRLVVSGKHVDLCSAAVHISR